MTPDVRLRWSGEVVKKSSGAWTGEVTFDVVGVTNSADALLALAGAPYFLEPDANDPPTHPASDLMYLESLSPADAGFRHWIITATYSTTPLGYHPNPGNPLLDPARYEWQIGAMSEPIDRDVYGNPILNAAMDAFAQSPNEESTILSLIITRNEPIFNPLLALAFMHTVNSLPMTFLKIWTIPPGQVYCRNIAPIAAASTLSPFTPVRYVFDIRRPYAQTIDSDGLWDSWKLRILNQGIRGWWDDSGTKKIGDFCDDLGNRISSDVRLGPTGKPLDATWQVLGAGVPRTPVDAPTALPALVIAEPSTQLDDVAHQPVAYFLKYLTKYKVDFGALNL